MDGLCSHTIKSLTCVNEFLHFFVQTHNRTDVKNTQKAL